MTRKHQDFCVKWLPSERTVGTAASLNTAHGPALVGVRKKWGWDGEGLEMEAKRPSSQMRDPQGYRQREPGKCLQGWLESTLENTLIDSLSCLSCSCWKRSREASHVVTWNNPRLMEAVQVTKCADKEELMRDLLETLRPCRAYDEPTALPLPRSWTFRTLWQELSSSYEANLQPRE